jgi:peroxiredoxin
LKKGPVVLYFYPKSFTSVCTVEAHEFAENIENFSAAGASVIGISGDKIEVQRDFFEQRVSRHVPGGRRPQLFGHKSLRRRVQHSACRRAFANRISYVISPEGKILHAYSDSHAEKHIENSLAAVKKWREEHKLRASHFASRRWPSRSGLYFEFKVSHLYKDTYRSGIASYRS